MRYTLKKEFLLIARDIHAVTVLFVMPALFILIMSLAMQDLFALHSPVRIDVLALNRDGGKESQAFLKAMGEQQAFRLHLLAVDVTQEGLAKALLERDVKFALIVKEGFSSFVRGEAKGGAQGPLEMLVDPTVNAQTQLLLKNTLDGRLGRLKAALFLAGIGGYLDAAGIDSQALQIPEESAIEVRYVHKEGRYNKIPSAVQQSVPAWLVFSMFFIVIPLSNTFISERGQGTLMRLKSMNVSRLSLILGKMIPYLLINAIQVVLMIAIGVMVVPLLGGTALTLGVSLGGLVLIAAAVSFCAISLALCIASFAGTTEQATTIGAVLNIIFGALGGIMVPKFVMPGFMQDLAALSPLSWGLEGFLDIFLRNGGAADVLPESLALLAFGAVMLTLTAILLRRRREVR
jgi:ABC-2 type transport system permease protein